MDHLKDKSRELLLCGYLFHPSWFSPLEGPLTRLGKVVRVNSLTTEALINELLGWAKTTRAANSNAGHSLLDLGWIRPHNPELISAVFLNQSSAFEKQAWFREMAGDERIRYCPTCLEQGFHSTLCQIAGIERCPSHSDYILDFCLSCKAPTPRFALTRQTFERPLCCPNCSQSYAPSWASSARLGGWKQVEHLIGYADLAKWLISLDKGRIHWPSHSTWLSCIADERGRQHKRVMTFEVLSFLNKGPIRKEPSRVCIQLFPPSTSFEFEQLESEVEMRARLQIYKSIRRRASRRLKAWRLLPGLWDELFQLPGCGGVLSRSNAVPSELLGLLMWRRRFERYMNPRAAGASPKDNLELHPEALAWPGKCKVATSTWGHFAYRCLAQDCKTAADWTEELENLPSVSEPRWRSAWSDLLTRWHQRGVPGAQRASDSVSQLWIHDRHGRNSQFALVWSP